MPFPELEQNRHILKYPDTANTNTAMPVWTYTYRLTLRVEMCVDIPRVTNQQANNQHEDLDIGLDDIFSVAEPAQPRHVLDAQDLVELDLPMDLHHDQIGDGEETKVLSVGGGSLNVEDEVREEPVLLV